MPSKARGNTLLSDSAVYLFSNILNASIPFVLLPILTRYLSPAEYGKVAIFQTAIAALGGFVGLNVVGAAGRKYYDSQTTTTELRLFIASCLQILAVSSVAILGLIFIFRSQLAHWLGLEPTWILLAVAVAAMTVLVQIRLGQWQVRKSARHYGALQISHSLLNMLLSLWLVIVLTQGVEGRLLAQTASVVVAALVALLLLKRDGLLRFFVWKPEYLKEALAFGVPLIPHVAGLFLLSSVDRIVINTELGLAEAGIYMVAVQLASAMAIVFDSVNNAYVPWLFERLNRNQPHEMRQIVRFTYAWFALVLCIAAMVFLGGPLLITMIAGSQYARAGEVIGWLALGQAFGGMYLMVTNYIFYSKRTGLLSIATLMSGALNITLLVFLIRLIGLPGAAMAYCITMAVRFLLTWWVAQVRHPMPWFSLNTAH